MSIWIHYRYKLVWEIRPEMLMDDAMTRIAGIERAAGANGILT